MKINTKYFGEIDCDETQVLRFPKGLFGFEEETSFALLSFEGDGMLLCLQSMATPQLAFVMMDPFALDGSYAPVLQPEELEALEVDDSQELYYYVLCAVKNPVSESTVNMRCPVAINGDAQCAMQVILEDAAWHMRHKLAEFSKEEASC